MLALANVRASLRVAARNAGMVILTPTVMVRQIILVVQASYAQAAVRQSVAGIDLSVNNQDTATSTSTFEPGSIFAPFIIINGRPDAINDSNHR